LPDEKTGEAVKLVIVRRPGLTEEKGASTAAPPHRLQAAQGIEFPHRIAEDAVGKSLRRECATKY